jgi:hypothetical protein
MTAVLHRSLGGATVPLVVVESAVAVTLVVWHRVRNGRILVTSKPPRRV